MAQNIMFFCLQKYSISLDKFCPFSKPSQDINQPSFLYEQQKIICI